MYFWRMPLALSEVLMAIKKKLPLLVDLGDRQVFRLPCVRSSRGVETELRKFCEGCNSSSLWNEKGRSCADGKSCYHQLVAARKIAVTYLPDGYHQNLAEWGDSSDLQKWRRILQRIFYVPVPADSKLSLPPAPSANDLVLSFRCYHGARIFDPKDLRLLTPPFDFFKFAVDHHRRHKTSAQSHQIWVVAEPAMRKHPTVVRLQTELNAQVLTGNGNRVRGRSDSLAR